jgi:hypothetical protein
MLKPFSYKDIKHCTQKECFLMLKPILTRKNDYCFQQQNRAQISEKTIKKSFLVSFALRSFQYNIPQVVYDRDAGQMPAYFACLLLLNAARDNRRTALSSSPDLSTMMSSGRRNRCNRREGYDLMNPSIPIKAARFHG